MAIGTLPGNRFNNPDESFVDTTGLPYAGGFLYFYASNTSTPQNTYNNADLDSAHANANPVTLDSAGRLPNAVWLQALAYKVVLTDSNLNQIWSADPVYTSDYSTIAQFQTYTGNPNGNVAGTAGSGAVLSSVVWDRSNNLLYVCTTSGIAAAAVWTQVAANLSSSVVFSSTITPTNLTANTDNWAPTGFSTAYTVRASATAAWNLTGLAGGASGREILLSNIGAFNITLVGNSGSSTAANRFLLDADLVLLPTEAVSLAYDGTSAGWRRKDPTSPLVATQAQQETSTSAIVYVAPSVQQFHPSAAKCWAYVTVSGGTPTLVTNYNITSITDTATGKLTITIATDFSTANWAAIAMCGFTDPGVTAIITEESTTTAKAAGSVALIASNTSPGFADPVNWNFCGFGDQ